MSPTLVWILVLSIRGRLLRWVRMLRQPKYLVGFGIGLVYLGFWARRFTIGRDFESPFFVSRSEKLGDVASLIPLLLAFALLVFLTLVWLTPWGRLGLPFREAELMLLLPAPLSRRQVIQFALLKGQAPILTSALLVSLFTGSGRPGDQIRLIFSLWLAMTLLDLNKKGRALFLLRQREIARRVAIRRRLLVLGGIAAFWTLLASALVRSLTPTSTTMPSGQLNIWDLFVVVAEDAGTGLSGALLAPFLWITTLPFTGSWLGFATGCLPVAAMVVLGHEAVVRSKASFEESALQQARESALRKSPARRFLRLSKSARLRNPFRLHPQGIPELAILWKNTHLVLRSPLSRVAGWTAAGLAVVALVPAALDLPGIVFGLVGTLGAGMTFLAPLFALMGLRNDFRSDLGHLDLIRTWPVRPSRLAAAELLAPALAATAAGAFGAMLCLAAIVGARLRWAFHGTVSDYGLLPPDGSEFMGLPMTAGIALIVVAVVPVLAGGTALLSSLRNVGILAFPAWVGSGSAPSRGVGALGQQMLVGTALIVGLILALIPSAALVGAAMLIQWSVGVPWSAWAFPVWGVLAAAPLLVEFVILVKVASKLWQAMDPSQEILELGR